MIFKTVGGAGLTDPKDTIIKLRCPGCHKNGTLESLGGNDVQLPITPTGEYFLFGQRRCPDSECGTHIFFVKELANAHLRVTASYPAERIDFDTINIPAKVVQALEEAITCHANDCQIAGAIMVRKTLEELCSDQGATGDNLKERIKSLGAKIVLPTALLDGLDDLRLLGNDAAHIESQEFNQIGTEEVEVGIEFTKEVLKAAYQYEAILTRLRGLKRSS